MCNSISNKILLLHVRLFDRKPDKQPYNNAGKQPDNNPGKQPDNNANNNESLMIHYCLQFLFSMIIFECSK